MNKNTSLAKKKIYSVKFEFRMENKDFIGMCNISCEPNCIASIKAILYKKFIENGYKISNLVLTSLKVNKNMIIHK